MKLAPRTLRVPLRLSGRALRIRWFECHRTKQLRDRKACRTQHSSTRLFTTRAMPLQSHPMSLLPARRQQPSRPRELAGRTPTTDSRRQKNESEAIVRYQGFPPLATALCRSPCDAAHRRKGSRRSPAIIEITSCDHRRPDSTQGPCEPGPQRRNRRRISRYTQAQQSRAPRKAGPTWTGDQNPRRAIVEHRATRLGAFSSVPVVAGRAPAEVGASSPRPARWAGDRGYRREENRP